MVDKFSPNDISRFIRFNSEDEYQKDEYDSNRPKTMYDLQEEGVAGILNRFDKFKIALLADEVGMGKTYQALAVITWQFKIKPNSKVLVITPRKEVLNQWKNEEYKEFYEKHIIGDNKYIPPFGSEKIDELYNFSNGLFNCGNESANIIFAKATSFSTKDNFKDEREKKLLSDIRKFDLIVLDEAHKFRNYFTSKDNIDEHHSYIIQTAKMLFSQINPEANVLLMTATPLHSRRGDLKRIVDLFNDQLGSSDEEIMKAIMIRRLRVMSTGHNKYQYRKELADSVKLTGESQDYKNELFFAMLQKEYIKDEKSKNLSNSKHLLDYMEGTRFDRPDEEEGMHDKHLQIVLNSYTKHYKGIFPSNRKYEVLINFFNRDEKGLVFVRRTASAYEIARKYLENFDRKAWKIIDHALDKEVSLRIPRSRQEFEKIIRRYQEQVDSEFDEKIDKLAELLENHPSYEEKIQEFRQDETNIPEGKNYITKKTAVRLIAHRFYEYYDNFSERHLEEYFEKYNGEKDLDNDDPRIPKSSVLDFFTTKKGQPSTHASRFLRRFSSPHSPYANFFSKEFIEIIDNEDYTPEKYDLIKSAVLHSSIGLVELYACYIAVGKDYELFVTEVSKNRDSFEFVREIEEFLEHFEKFKKYLIFNENTDEDKSNEESMDDDSISVQENKVYNPEIFYHSQPAYPYTGSTKNKHVIARFNSPFFPKLLCGTSTLQEGVNLHLFCNKVYHFGAAHTMGDDEQRIGRVDRLMGKMDRELANDSTSTLDIFYPYLESTYDEDNLKNMLCKKRNTEYMIDKGDQIINENEVYECEKQINELIYTPDKVHKDTLEPYPW